MSSSTAEERRNEQGRSRRSRSQTNMSKKASRPTSPAVAADHDAVFLWSGKKWKKKKEEAPCLWYGSKQQLNTSEYGDKRLMDDGTTSNRREGEPVVVWLCMSPPANLSTQEDIKPSQTRWRSEFAGLRLGYPQGPVILVTKKK